MRGDGALGDTGFSISLGVCSKSLSSTFTASFLMPRPPVFVAPRGFRPVIVDFRPVSTLFTAGFGAGLVAAGIASVGTRGPVGAGAGLGATALGGATAISSNEASKKSSFGAAPLGEVTGLTTFSPTCNARTSLKIWLR